MPSLGDEGWLNYDTGPVWLERRDPEGIPTCKVCGEENVKLRTPPLGLPIAEAPGREVSEDLGFVAPYRAIGQGSNPYSPPARFLFYHQDHLGSPRAILDDTGTLVATHHYLPFGEERPTAMDPTPNTKAFTGHERDADTGLDYWTVRSSSQV
jgi:hypothetical protein